MLRKWRKKRKKKNFFFYFKGYKCIGFVDKLLRYIWRETKKKIFQKEIWKTLAFLLIEILCIRVFKIAFAIIYYFIFFYVWI